VLSVDDPGPHNGQAKETDHGWRYALPTIVLTGVASGPAVQPGYLRDLALAHEESGFDRVLVAHSSATPDGFTVADQVLTGTTGLGVLLARLVREQVLVEA
jgi:alkanesulfonate monooxygenase SsuD/methylene tetrahydromethanopterin reductase-like flavin-dependent oxidoreductase (luciferase family)